MKSKWFTIIPAIMLVAALFVINSPATTYATDAAGNPTPPAANAAGEFDTADFETPPPPPEVPAAAGVAPQAPSSWRCPQCGFHCAGWDRPNRDGHRHMMDQRGKRGWNRPGRDGHFGMRSGRERRGAMAGKGPGIAAARILRHAKQLELDEQQISKLEEISMEARKQMVDLRAAIEKEQLELEELLHADGDDLTAIRKHLNALAGKHVDVQELKLRNWIEVKKILTEDQKEMIQKKHPRMGAVLD